MLGKIEDEKKYVALSNKIKEAFNERYLNRANGLYGEGRQAEQAMPLYWGLIPEELKSKAAAHLAERVIKDGKHIDVGIFGAMKLLVRKLFLLGDGGLKMELLLCMKTGI